MSVTEFGKDTNKIAQRQAEGQRFPELRRFQAFPYAALAF